VVSPSARQFAGQRRARVQVNDLIIAHQSHE